MSEPNNSRALDVLSQRGAAQRAAADPAFLLPLWLVAEAAGSRRRRPVAIRFRPRASNVRPLVPYLAFFPYRTSGLDQLSTASGCLPVPV